MLIKLAALGALGYVGYRYLAEKQLPRREPAAAPAPQLNAVAGGPLSNQATLQHSPDAPATGEPLRL